MEGTAASWPGPLAGLRVLDLTRVLAGPLATQFLGDLGAEIIKVEPPGGDDTRGFPPHIGGESHYFLGLNRGKRSLVLDLRQEAGAAILKRLANACDVLVENFRPGVMERLGIGAAALMEANPRLIWCAISGFGQHGPLRDEPSFDIVTQALTGVMSVNGSEGGPPTKLGLPVGDMSGGIFGAISILAALHERHSTGRGRLIDVSLYDGTMSLLGHFAQLPAVTGADPVPMGSRHPSVVPYDAFPARDGTIVIACLADRFWPRLCAALEAPELAADPRYATTAARRGNRATLEPTIAAITATRTVAEWEVRLRAEDVPHAPVLGVTAALAHPHAAARGMVEVVQHPTAGPLRLLGRPVKFPGAPQTPLRPPPRLGENGEAVLREVLGVDEAELTALRNAGVIGED